VQVFGGYGYTTDYPVERYLREVKVMQIFEGTNQIQRMVIGRHLTASPSPDRALKTTRRVVEAVNVLDNPVGGNGTR
jgi:hypothetical protein